ncbi:hypothetical protein [Bacteroides sp.]
MTKRRLYLFNPEHDLALANGNVNYMAPASARQMAEELALLPAWYARPRSAVLAPSAYNLVFLREMQQCLSLPVDLMTESEIASEEGLQPMPWGWNPALRRKLQLLGMSETELPALSRLEELRCLSHRSQAVELLPRLQLDEFFCGESFYLTEPEEWKRFVENHASCLLKAPLSGSGKGLNWCKGVFTDFISGWCRRVAEWQGGVVAEPVYNKVMDFAMEFFSDGEGRVSFVGYSLFSTNGSGAYEANLLLPDEEIGRRLSVYVPEEAFSRLKQKLEEELSARFGSAYSGYLGVDMMICRFASEEVEYRIHPCVEINLRMNMGVVAHSIYKRYVSPGSAGCFSVTYHPSHGEALQMHEQMKADFPLQVENGRIVAGYMPLVPVTSRSIYRAWICIHPVS